MCVCAMCNIFHMHPYIHMVRERGGFVRAKDVSVGLLNIIIGFPFIWLNLTNETLIFFFHFIVPTSTCCRFLFFLILYSFVERTRSGFVMLLNPFLPVDICVPFSNLLP